MPHAIEVGPLPLSLYLGQTQQLTVLVLDSAGHELAGAPVTYQTSNAAVVTVSNTGLVTAEGPGLAAITVRSSPAAIVVNASVSGIAEVEVNTSDTVITAGQTLQVSASVRADDGALLPQSLLSWQSRDPAIVTVSNTGLVTPVGVGTTWIRAAAALFSDSVRVTAVVNRVALSGNPFAAAVHPSGAAYVTRLGVGAATRINVITHSPGAHVSVGLVPTSVAFDGAGTTAYVGNQEGGSVSVLSVAANTVTGTIPIAGSPTAVEVLPGDSLLLVASSTGQAYFVRLATGAIADSVPTSSYANAIFTQGTRSWLSSPGAQHIVEVNLATRTVIRNISVPGSPQAIIVSANGQELYVANEIGQLQFWNLGPATPTLVGQVALPNGGGFSLARHPVSGHLFVGTSYFGQDIHVIDPSLRARVRSIAVGGTVRRLAFAADGSVGIVANEGGWVDFIR